MYESLRRKFMANILYHNRMFEGIFFSIDTNLIEFA